MAERRMVSKTIMQTQKFLRLPLETQALYVHLVINSDDDGIVEAFPVVRMIGASEDSLGLLVIKQFIKPLNQDMVYFITDFNEQNKIRPDRHKPSIHRNLAIQQLGLEVDGSRLVEPGKAVLELTEEGQAVDGQVTDKCPHSIGEGSIGKGSIDNIPYKEIIDYLNSKTGKKYRDNVQKNKSLIKARWSEGYRLEDFKQVIDNMVTDWSGTKYAKYLRPETLFGTKFDGYLNQGNIVNREKKTDERLGF
ncbi:MULTISPECIES: conserved phage C-terminal domain-containing protein [Streptococcus]|uniref:conserved phage C-terminal domain-containing protein n=1 Tax=Streptococcus TaxID=1301 RepID=UPI0020C86ED2|nr:MULTISPECIES: conserved phage C-terminal domain-containing protein [Streptococcus]MCP9069033.1 conserved phage C-terminal domain-containing protein [Streptococcus parasanguinis]MCP9082757.1 conserved phage C-terminal domain-containing protein [Streptococcus sp. CF10-1]